MCDSNAAPTSQMSCATITPHTLNYKAHYVFCLTTWRIFLFLAKNIGFEPMLERFTFKSLRVPLFYFKIISQIVVSFTRRYFRKLSTEVYFTRFPFSSAAVLTLPLGVFPRGSHRLILPNLIKLAPECRPRTRTLFNKLTTRLLTRSISRPVFRVLGSPRRAG